MAKRTKNKIFLPADWQQSFGGKAVVLRKCRLLSQFAFALGSNASASILTIPKILGLILFPFLFCGFAFAEVYKGSGESLAIEISPRQAELEARGRAFARIVEQAGVNVSTADLSSNELYRRYVVVQSDAVRIVHPECTSNKELREINDLEVLAVRVDCRAKVIRTGAEVPKPLVKLTTETKTPDCQAKKIDSLEENTTFRRMEGYCLFVQVPEDLYVAIFGAYEEGTETRLTRLHESATGFLLKKEAIFSSGRLMSEIAPGAKHSGEAFFVLISRRPLLLDGIPYMGASYEETLANSAGMDALDSILLKQTNPSQIRLLTLPYLIVR